MAAERTSNLINPVAQKKPISWWKRLFLLFADFGEPVSGALEAGAMVNWFVFTLQNLLFGLLKAIFFPILAGLFLINTLSVWGSFYKEKNKGSLVKAIAYTTSRLIVAVAVILGMFIASGIVTALSPILITLSMGLKTIFNICAAIWYAARAYSTEEPAQKQIYKSKAIGFAIGAFAGAILTVGFAFVSIAGKPIYAVLGVAGASLGVLFGGIAIFKTYQARKNKMPQIFYPLDKGSLINDAIVPVAPHIRLTRPFLETSPVKKGEESFLEKNKGSSGIPVVIQEKAEIERVHIDMNQNVEHTTSENLKKPWKFLKGQNSLAKKDKNTQSSSDRTAACASTLFYGRKVRLKKKTQAVKHCSSDAPLQTKKSL